MPHLISPTVKNNSKFIEKYQCTHTLINHINLLFLTVLFVLFITILALMSYRMGDFQEAYTCTQRALKIYPNHGDSKELLVLLQKIFSSM